MGQCLRICGSLENTGEVLKIMRRFDTEGRFGAKGDILRLGKGFVAQGEIVRQGKKV